MLAVLCGLGVPAYADRASAAFKRGTKAERSLNFDEAFSEYKTAYTVAPANPKYLAAYTRMRFSAASQHVRSGQMLLNTGAPAEAIVQFQRAIDIDSSSFIAQQEMRRAADMIRRQERERLSPKVDTPFSLSDSIEPSVELKPLSSALLSIHLTANADVAYKTVGKLAGLNVVIDPDYKPQKVTVDLTDVTLRQALEVIRLQSRTFWRPVLANTIVVTADSPNKRKEFEQNVMRTFYLRNITAPSELQDAANAVKQMLDVNHVQLLSAQDAIMLRGTPDQMLLAEKLLSDLDKPKSEVIIDLTVMQVSRARIRNIGAGVPTSASINFLPKVNLGTTTSSTTGTTTSGTSTSGTSTSTSGGGNFTFGSFVVSVPGASFTLLSSDSNTKILQRPQIRALNNEKATLRIGDRVPIATGSFQPGLASGGSVSPLISTQFTYLDVGVNIDITPHIHSNGEVTLKMALEISSVTGEQNLGGITQPTIGQRRIEHEIQLTDGEVNLLGGLLEDSETKSLSGYPLLSSIPLLKYLFAQDNKQRNENEVVFAITPHIVRALHVSEDDLRAIDVGTGNSIELRRKQPASPDNSGAPGTEPGKPQAPSQAPSIALPPPKAPSSQPSAK